MMPSTKSVHKIQGDLNWLQFEVDFDIIAELEGLFVLRSLVLRSVTSTLRNRVTAEDRS